MSEKAGSGGANAMPWYHKNIGRMETEKLLMECREDGAFLIRESDTVRGAYVLSTIYQQRIHHYRILPNEEGKLSIQAQQGVQRKNFTALEELVNYYSQPRRGLVCGLTMPLAQQKEEEEPPEPEEESDDEPDEISREKNIISKFLLASLSTVDQSRVDDPFLECLRSYLNSDVSTDVESMVTPAPQLTFFKGLFNKDCKLLHKQLDKMMLQVELVQTLFGRAGGAKSAGQTGTSSRRRRSKIGDEDFDSLIYKLNECAESVQNLETTAFQMLRELSISLTGRPAHGGSLSQTSGSTPLTNGPQENDEEVVFDVKIEGLSGKKTCSITVSLKEGTLRFCKQGDSLGTTFDHYQLLQLVKSRSKAQRLGILFEGQNRKDYTFNSMQSREHFCQLVQLIRNRMRSDQDQDSVSVFVGSWNMGDAAPPSDISSWFTSMGLGKTLPAALAHAHDIYALGMQECSISDKDWTAKVKYTLKHLYDIDYEKVVVQTLWGIRFVLFVKPEHSKKITHLQCSQVRTGIGNVAGNKGAVGVSFHFGSLSLCFISSHLTSGSEKCHRRNQNYYDILKGMGPLKQRSLGQFDLTNQFHHLFFFGDLNYRVELGAPEIVEYAKHFDHSAIYQEDQLQKDKDKKKIFVGFEEAPILFPPTYRFAKGRRSLDDYVWVKNKRSGIRINVPSYCDRVLWKSYPGTSISNTSYGCTKDIATSDHSPVFATFRIGGVKQYVSETANPTGLPSSGKNAFIVVDSCKAKVQTSSRTYFYIEFHSTCFEGVVKSAPNNDWINVLDEPYVKPVWCGREHIAKIRPIVTEQEYLEQQHLLFMFKSQESDEPYAECCISLRNVIGASPMSVCSELIHQGLSVGELEVYMNVTLDHYKKVEEEHELYSDVNFITAELELETSLDFRGRSRSTASSSVSDVGTRPERTSIGARPMMPLPYASSYSSVEKQLIPGRRSSGEYSGSQEAPPPPLPRRSREPLPGSLPAASLFGGRETSRPAVPARRTESMGLHRTRPNVPLRFDGQQNMHRPPGGHSPPLPRARNISEGPPVPVKRRTTPRPGSASSDQPPPLPTRGGTSDIPPVTPRHMNTDLPPLPPKSSEPSPSVALPLSLPPHPSDPKQQAPTVPLRQIPSQGKPRPLSTVEKLLQAHGLQHFSERLITNGYDDVHFINEISDEELQEIGITQTSDRSKLLRIFQSYGH